MLNLVVHYAINIGSLGGWAGGSIFLILNTYYTTYMTMFSAMLMLGEPSFMMAPYNFRLTIFVASTVTVSLGGWGGFVYGFRSTLKTPASQELHLWGQFLLIC